MKTQAAHCYVTALLKRVMGAGALKGTEAEFNASCQGA